LQYALATQAGFVAAVLAHAGITGPRGVILGEYGLARHYSVGGMDLEGLFHDLGIRYRNTGATTKIYACGGFSHRAIEGMLGLASQHGISWNDIDRIAVRINQHGYRRVCVPIEAKRAPRTFMDAQFSIPFTVAMAAVLGDVFLDEMTEAAMRDPRILSLAGRVDCLHDPALDVPGLMLTPVVVEVMTRGGATHRTKVDHVRGHPAQPLAPAELAEKFRRVARHGDPVLPAGRVEAAIAALGRLTDLDDVRELTALLRAEP
jgi:2-methylcitrate dehydratase PrpD